MDFGLARTLEGDGMTQTGALVGTMDYMSPEQALGKDLDQRSDVFAMGLIFYELLTGKMPYKADSVVASLLKRTQERAAPVSSHDASIPKPLSNIVGKCMEPDVKLRYQSSAEILADLDAWQGGRAAATLNFPSGVKPWGRSFPWHWFGTAAAVVVLAIVGFMFRDKLFAPNAKTPSGPVALATHPASRSWWPIFRTIPPTRFSTTRWNQCSMSHWKAPASSTLTAAETHESWPRNFPILRTSSTNNRLGWLA